MDYRNNNSGLPLGFTFEPTDQDLLIYLWRKINALPLPCDFAIIDCDLYDGKDQWIKIFEETGEKSLYFFTKLKKIAETGHRNHRTCTDFGTWRETQKNKDIIWAEQTQILGTKRGFKFIPKHGFHLDGRWLMDEYRLHSTFLDKNHLMNEYVVCHVKREKELRSKLYNLSAAQIEGKGKNNLLLHEAVNGIEVEEHAWQHELHSSSSGNPN